MVVADEASRCAMEAADGSKEEGIVVMPIVIPDPPETGGVKAMRIGKGNQQTWSQRSRAAQQR